MSMTAPIPKEVREQLENEPRMKRCAIGEGCEGVIQWHHWFSWSGKRVSDPWCLISLCEKHHREEAKYREFIKWIGLNIADDETLERYSKAENYIETRKRLNKIYAPDKH